MCFLKRIPQEIHIPKMSPDLVIALKLLKKKIGRLNLPVYVS